MSENIFAIKPQVTLIPINKQVKGGGGNGKRKLRVCAYARVSTSARNRSIASKPNVTIIIYKQFLDTMFREMITEVRIISNSTVIYHLQNKSRYCVFLD